MNSNPKISVIIPVYNTGLPLRCCLDSIAQQTYRNLEIILVDDGSSDGSERACDEYAAKDVRFKVIHQKNAGVSNARNAGLAIATGDYFQFPDSDDYLELDSYEYLLGLFEKHQCDVVNFEYYVTFSNHEKRHHLSEENYGLVDRKRAHEIVWNGESFACNKLYKATFVTGKDIDWNNTSPLAPVKFRPDIYRGEDSLFVHSVLEEVEWVWFDKRPLYHYVQSAQSACRGHFRISQLSAMKLYDAYRELFGDKYPELVKGLSRWQCSLSISLYCDMWLDEKIFKEERQILFQHFKRMFQLASNLCFKEYVKFGIFRLSPQLFCLIHKLIHGL